MPRYKVAICCPTHDGSVRSEVANFQVRAVEHMKSDPAIAPLIDAYFFIPIQQVPTYAARNRIVQECQERAVDFCYMVDDDAYPNYDFFAAAFHFLRTQQKPAVIGSPYCCAPPDEKVQVFEIYRTETDTPLDSWALERVTREDAAQRVGVQRVASIGTHVIAYDMRVFEKISRPYFDYRFEDQTLTKVIETEDCYCHRLLFNAGVPLYVDWSHWSGHWKLKLVQKPIKLGVETIPEFWLNKAKHYLLHSEAGRRLLESTPAPQQNGGAA